MVALGDAVMSPRVTHVATAGVGLVLAGVLAIVLARAGDPLSGHWPALRAVSFLCGVPLLVGRGVERCVGTPVVLLRRRRELIYDPPSEHCTRISLPRCIF